MCVREAASGASIARATVRKPAWTWLPGSGRKSAGGEVGAGRRFVDQSEMEEVPRMAMRMVDVVSRVRVVIVRALVLWRGEAGMWWVWEREGARVGGAGL